MQNIWCLAHMVFTGTVVCHQLWRALAFFSLRSADSALCVCFSVWPIQNPGDLIKSEPGVTFKNRKRNVSYRSSSLPEISICQLSYFGCCYFSLEMAGVTHTQKANKTPVWVCKGDTIWKAAIWHCLVTADVAWIQSVSTYQFITYGQKCTRNAPVYMFRWRTKATMPQASKWSSALNSASVPMWCSPVSLLKSCRSHQKMCYSVHGSARL